MRPTASNANSCWRTAPAPSTSTPRWRPSASRWGLSRWPICRAWTSPGACARARPPRATRRARYVHIADRLCEAGRLGRKTGAGCYRYDAGARKPLPDPAVHAWSTRPAPREGITAARWAATKSSAARCWRMVNEAALLLGEGMAAARHRRRRGDGQRLWLSALGRRPGILGRASAAGRRWPQISIGSKASAAPASCAAISTSCSTRPEPRRARQRAAGLRNGQRAYEFRATRAGRLRAGGRSGPTPGCRSGPRQAPPPALAGRRAARHRRTGNRRPAACPTSTRPAPGPSRRRGSSRACRGRCSGTGSAASVVPMSGTLRGVAGRRPVQNWARSGRRRRGTALERAARWPRSARGFRSRS